MKIAHFFLLVGALCARFSAASSECLSDNNEPLAHVIQLSAIEFTESSPEGQSISATAFGETTVVHDIGEIVLEVTGPTSASHWEELIYFYNVSYNADDFSDAKGVAVRDSQCSPLLYVSGDTDNDKVLDDGLLGEKEFWIFTCTSTMPPHKDGESDVIQHVITATGTTFSTDYIYGATSFETLKDDDEGVFEVDIMGPALAFPGQSVEYTYVVRYDSADGSSGSVTFLTDDQCDSPVYNSGDKNGNGRVDVSEAWVYYCTTTFTETTEHNVRLEGTDYDDEETVPVNELFHTAASVASLLTEFLGVYFAASNSTVTFSYGVSLHSQSLSTTADSITLRVEDICVPEYASGDEGISEVLELGETWVYQCQFELIQHRTADDITHAIAASGRAFDGATDVGTVSATAFGSTIIEHAIGSLKVQAFAPASARPGDDFTLYYEITYSSDDGSPAQLLNVTDSSCFYPEYLSGDLNSNNLLDPDEVWVYDCVCTMPDSGNLVHEVVVNGFNIDGESVLEGVDDATVSLSEGALRVKFEGVYEGRHGDEVTFQYSVSYKNDVGPGYITDVAVNIGNDVCDTPPVYVYGNNDDDQLSQVEVWVFECTALLSSTHFDSC